jgi:photosystem II stability/assembly factor-like uncharacterized protein
MKAMKKIYFLLVALFLMNGVGAQWVQQKPGTTRGFHSVYFTDSVTGYVVGNAGIILKTINGGSNWTDIYQGILNQPLHSVYFTDVNTGYAVGGYVEITPEPIPQWIMHQVILKTTNAGVTWTTLSSGTNYPLYSVYFTNAYTGFAVGEDVDGHNFGNSGVLLRTFNGGATWTRRSIPGNSGYGLTSVHFPDANHGYIVNSGGYYPGGNIIKTIDGGSTWTTLPIGPDYYIAAVYFTDVNTGYAVGSRSVGISDGIILKTIDGGSTWTDVYQGKTGQMLNSVYFPDANTGYAVGESGTILKTTNGGTSWNTLSSGTDNSLASVYFIDANTGFVVGEGGTILKTTNGGGHPQGMNDQHSTLNSLKIFPNPSSDKITISATVKGPLYIINLKGQQLLQHEITNSTTTIDLHTLPGGVYIVKLFGEEGLQVVKFIKK